MILVHNRIWTARNKVLIAGRYDPMVVRIIKDDRLTAADRIWNQPPFQKCWQLSLGPVTAEVVAKLQSDHGYGVDPNVWDKLRHSAVEENEMIVLSQAHDYDLDPIPGLKKELLGFQRSAVEYAIRAKRTWISQDPGLGKTVIVEAIVEKLQSYPAVIVCKKSVKWQWASEINDALPHRTFYVIEGPPKAGMALPDVDFYILTFSMVGKWSALLKQKKPQLIAADESHMISNPAAQRTKACIALARDVPYRYCVSATPEANGPVDAEGQLMFMGHMPPSKREREETTPIFTSKSAFEVRYCEAHSCTMRGNTFWQTRACKQHGTNGSRYETELARIYAQHCKTRHVKRGPNGVANQLPPQFKTVVPIQLSNQAEYDAAEMRYLERLTTGQLETWEHLQHIEEMRQLCLKGKWQGMMEWIDEALDADDQGNIPEIGRKMVLFGHHREALKDLAEHLHAPMIMGGVSDLQRKRIRESFQTQPTPRTVVCSMRAAGEGLNLDAADRVVFIELDWTPTVMKQCLERVDRLTQKSDTVNGYYLVAGIDLKILRILTEKGERLEKISDSVAAQKQVVLSDLIAEMTREAKARLSTV